MSAFHRSTRARLDCLLCCAAISFPWLAACASGLAKEPILLKGHSGAITCLAFSSNGTLLASGSKDGVVRVWDLNTGNSQYSFSGHTRMATDVAGGLLGTMPSAADLEDSLTGKYIRKYLAANPEYATVDRMKVLRLIENLVAGAGAVGYLIESMHGAGPPTAQRIMIRRQAQIGNKVDKVKALLDIK